MAGSSWPQLVAGQKAKASEVESKFDWLEGSLVPMNSGATTNAVFDVGTTTAAWRHGYFTGFVAVGSLPSTSTPSIWFRGSSVEGGIGFESTGGGVIIRFFKNTTTIIEIGAGATSATFSLNELSNTGAAPIYRFTGNLITGMGTPSNTQGSLRLFGGGGTYLEFDHSGNIFRPVHGTSAGSVNLGDASNYWGDVSYKTLTDRGCLAWLDDGVECANGTKTTDLKAIMKIKKHPTKQTVYGKPMLDYKSFPKVSYKPAVMNLKDQKTRQHSEVVLSRDENDRPYYIDKHGKKVFAEDGIEMTSFFSIMIGAIKELAQKVEALEAK